MHIVRTTQTDITKWHIIQTASTLTYQLDFLPLCSVFAYCLAAAGEWQNLPQDSLLTHTLRQLVRQLPKQQFFSESIPIIIRQQVQTASSDNQLRQPAINIIVPTFDPDSTNDIIFWHNPLTPYIDKIPDAFFMTPFLNIIPTFSNLSISCTPFHDKGVSLQFRNSVSGARYALLLFSAECCRTVAQRMKSVRSDRLSKNYVDRKTIHRTGLYRQAALFNYCSFILTINRTTVNNAQTSALKLSIHTKLGWIAIIVWKIAIIGKVSVDIA